MRILFWLLLATVLVPPASAATVVSGPGPLLILESAEILRDSAGNLDIRTVSDPAHAAFDAFEPLSGGVAMGFTDAVFWFRVRLARTPDSPSVWWLAIRQAFLDDVRWYAPDADGTYSELRAGDHVPLAERPLALRKTVFPVTLHVAPRTFYLRVETSSAMTVQGELWEPNAFTARHAADSTLQGAILALYAALALFALVCALWMRKAFFFVVTGYLLAHGLLHFQFYGYDQLLLYPQTPWIADNLIGATGAVALIMLILLALTYLQPWTHLPRLTRLLQGLTGLACLVVLMAAAGHYTLVASYLLFLVVISLFCLVVLIFGSWRFHPQRATLMGLMFLPGMTAVSLLVIFNLGIFPRGTWSMYLWELSVLFKMPLTAVVLWMCINEEQQQRRAHKQQDDAQRKLINMVAHELRTPLAVVRTAIANIEARTQQSNPELAPRFQRIDTALARINVLVDTALAEPRRETSRMGTEGRLLRPSELVEQIKSVLVLDEQHPLRVTLPEDDSPMAMDPEWLCLVVLSLIDNAVKYSPRGGEITLDVERVGGLTLRVCDEGIGVPEKARIDVFQPLFRAENALDLGVSGLGLGLYMVQQVAQSHGGKAYFDASEGPGACFVIHLPNPADRVPF
ncbi:MAG: 7TM-DISM domain-containing protein [Aquisalimonadaceae bacterium]